MSDIAGEPRRQSPTTAETSVSGLSDDFMDSIRSYAARRGDTMRAVYDEAISEMVARINSGEEIVFPAVIAGREWKARHIRLSPDVKVLLTNTCKRLRVHKSIFFHRALRDYLSSKGIEAPE